MDVIFDVCKNDDQELVVSTEEFKEAIESLNGNKSPNVFELTSRAP